MSRTAAGALAGLLVLVPACEQLTPLGGNGGECVPTEVQAAFDRSCGGGACHTAGGVAGGLALGAGQAAAAIGRASVGSPLPLIELGNTAGSYLAQKIMPAPTVAIVGERMPVGFQNSNADQVADVNTILGWIAGGEYAGCSVDTGTGGDTGTVANGLPCEVDDVLATYCRGCHGDSPVGATFALMSLDDLLAAAPTDASKSLGEQSVARMNDDARPMPPAPAARPSTAEIAVIADWVAAGMPAGECTVGPNPFDALPVCTSKKNWTGGNEEDPRMRPGLACNTCHKKSGEGPIFKFAGTVYPTGHEPDDCYGESSILVRVTDANGQVAEVKSNSTGNFMLRSGDAPAGFAPPYMIKVISDLGERAMAMPAPHGDCNVCHTQDGDENALGRIVSPW
jgi:hypothetical protein